MIILDTNVLSAIMQEKGDERIQAWLNRQPVLSVWITTVTVYEIRFGIELLPSGRRRQMLETSFGRILSEEINQILAFDSIAAEHAAALDASRRKRGNKTDSRDTFIAGIALAQRATLATRNVKHFADLDVPVIDPWTSP